MTGKGKRTLEPQDKSEETTNPITPNGPPPTFTQSNTSRGFGSSTPKTALSSQTEPTAPSIRSLAERSKSYKEAKQQNSGWLRFYTILAICTGIAMAGGAIPFFLNTTIPFLFFLSNKIILTSLTIVQIVVWAAIYGQNNSGFISEFYWRRVTGADMHNISSKAKDKTLNTISDVFKNIVNTVFPSSALSQRFFQNKETSLKHEVAQFDEFAKGILENGAKSNETIEQQQQNLKHLIQRYVLEKHGGVDETQVKEALDELKEIYEAFIKTAEGFTHMQHLSQADKARLAFQVANKDKEGMPEKTAYLSFDSGHVEVWNGNKFEKTKSETIEKLKEQIQAEAKNEFITAFEARKGLVESMSNYEFKIDHDIDFNSNPTSGADKSKNMLFLTYKNSFTMKLVDVAADFVGVVNAILVNAPGIAFSAIQLPAFFISMAAKVGIIASPIVPLSIAILALSLGLLAGWNAAHTVTRMKTRETCKEMVFSLVYLWHNENKWKLSNHFNWGKTYSALAFLIAFVISVGFCCFNAITGAVIGDTLYKLFVYHNFACITDPAIVLNPSITAATWVGKTLWWLGLLLTIPSTGSFLIGVEYEWISNLKDTVVGQYDYCYNQIMYKVSPRYYAGFAASLAIMPLSYLAFHALGFLPVISLFKVALLILIPASLYLLCFSVSDMRFRSFSEIVDILQSNIATILVLLMTFAVAAQISISTSTSPMWLVVLTQPQLMVCAAVTGIFGLVGFLYMFNSGLTGSIEALISSPSNIKSSDIIQVYKENISVHGPLSTFERIFPAEQPITDSPTKGA